MISDERVNSYNRFFSFSTDEQMLILQFLSMKLANMLVLLLSYMHTLKIYVYIVMLPRCLEKKAYYNKLSAHMVDFNLINLFTEYFQNLLSLKSSK